MEGRRVIQKKESISQPSFLKTEIIDGAISFEFSVDIDPDKLEGRRSGIVQDFVEKINKEVETSIRNGVENKGDLTSFHCMQIIGGINDFKRNVSRMVV